MVIDTVILKASYDLMTEEDAIAYSILKLTDDVAHGRRLQTVKLTRFVDNEGWDFLKFNFPVCGNLSSADLMVIYAGMNGFETYVVGNAERARRDSLIRRTLQLENVHSVAELDPALQVTTLDAAMRELSFVNTQRRGFAALPPEKRSQLVLEMAADQPLLYNTFRHALELSVEGMDLALNLNAVSKMRERVPSFIRNGYDKVENSLGEEVVIKENNNFAQNAESAARNEPVFRMIYSRRNGGKYLSIGALLKEFGKWNLAKALASAMTRLPEIMIVIPEMQEYLEHRKQLKKAASNFAMHTILNAVLSPRYTKDTVHVDATCDDLFACWDMDGLNNDYLGYRNLFEDNFMDLGRIMPYAEQVYRVNEEMERRGHEEGITTASAFERKYAMLAEKIISRINDGIYLDERLHINRDRIGMLQASGVEDQLLSKQCPEPKMIEDLEVHLATVCLQEFEQSRQRYMQERDKAR
jgi:hypothetical protein